MISKNLLTAMEAVYHYSDLSSVSSNIKRLSRELGDQDLEQTSQEVELRGAALAITEASAISFSAAWERLGFALTEYRRVIGV